ncbi:MAG: hypothetical protein Q8N63_08220, partial [Nanoarchaeota archaeon]|nr:hypothetical protein [Nanoarchaeota archaeon]
MRTYADNLKKQIIGQSKVNIVRLKILFSFMILLVLINISLFSAVDIVYDDFESGSLSGWNLISYGTAANWTSSTTNPYQGARHAQSQPLYTIEPASVIQRNISTLGYENIVFRYYKRNIGLDVADEFQAEWYNGTGWTLVESTGSSSSSDASYVSRSYSLPSSAANNPDFAIKFECTAGATSEYCRIDNVNISGTAMTDITSPTFSNPVENPVNNSGYISGQTYKFNVTINETGIDKCWIEFNGVNYTSISNISNVYMFNRTNLAAGTYSYKWWANDSLGNLNNSGIRYYTISKAFQAITPLLNGINNNLIITYPQQTNASYSGVNYTAATIKLNSTQINIGQNYTFAAGSYFLNYSMAGNENYTSYETYLNLTINKATSAIEMYINGTAGNQTGYYGIQTNVSVSLGNSEQTITLYKNGVDDTPNLNVYQILGIGDYNFTAVAGSTQNYSLLAITRYSHILCQENLQNTSWSSWINNGSCMTNDLQQQIKNLTQYDANSCGYANTTIYDYQNIGCDYCAPNRINTSLGDWAYIESCQTDDTRERQRNWTEYDENNCYAITGLLSDLSENITYFENSIENCDYCIPLAINTTWTDWANYGSCLTNDNQQQNKSREQYDSNGCYAITGLPADEFVNETFWDWQNISCNYCSYNVVNSSWSAWENISCLISNFMNQSRFKTEYDANYGICYAITGLSSDLWNSGENITYYEYRQTEICDYCALDLQNTTKGSWYFTEDCQPDDARERQRNWTQYDINDCGEIENQTYFENEDVACDFLTITCEVGGPYQQGALVLFMGNVANSDNAIVGEDVDIGLYKNNELNLSMILQTSEDGGFETSFSNLSAGSYKINSSVSYFGVNETCSKTFEIGSAASLVLDKTASIHNISNNEIFYNISLKILNTGGSDCINLSLNDIDYGFYEFWTISPGEIIEISYLMNFTRQNSTNYYLSQSAGIGGIDAYSDFLISANSSSINLTIPPSPYSP